MNTQATARVSVIIPSHNHGRYISNALESVLSQNIPDLEIIVVDDGSTDDTEAVVKLYPNVNYYRQSNAGPSAARNFGLKKSTGDYVVFLDADDWLLPDALISLPWKIVRVIGTRKMKYGIITTSIF